MRTQAHDDYYYYDDTNIITACPQLCVTISACPQQVHTEFTLV